MHTCHTIHYKDSRNLSDVQNNSVHLIVTSPPYPMISMWDKIFIGMNNKIEKYLTNNDGISAFKLMHEELKKVWTDIYRVLIPGGIACINIGDATRKVGKSFQLYPNSAEITRSLIELGFNVLPEIIWRKPSNSPTKFMGSGMIPTNAYVTLEHERILIFRKPGEREYKTEDDKLIRRQSSYFWEERNIWFSDIWYLNGIRQDINSKKIRARSGAFPFEIPFRLINMFSSKFDTVLDPFLGTATTTLAAIISSRNSVGYELDGEFQSFHHNEILSDDIIRISKDRIERRINEHNKYLYDHNKKTKYKSSEYGFSVVTKQEIDIKFDLLNHIKFVEKQNNFIAEYMPYNN